MKKDNNIVKIGSKGFFGMDTKLLLIISGLVIFGIVMVYSASYYYSIADYGKSSYYFIRQIVWVIGGFILMLIVSQIDYHLWINLWVPAYVVGLVLLLLLLIPGIGTNTYGATRWIYIGPISLMPGEIAKPCLILFITGYYTKYRDTQGDFVRGVLPVGFASIAYVFLIMKQPNMSTAFTVLFIAVGMLIVGGIKAWQFFMCAILGSGAGVALIFSSAYRRRRLLSFLDPFNPDIRLDEGWNAVQSLLALGTGGVFGKGLGNSVQKNLYLPMGHNDFILAIIGEELGFVGVLILMVAYMYLFYRGFRVSIKAKDYEGMMLAFGITFWIAIQVVIHFAVVTSSMPPTGVVLPYISYGGNAMLLFMGASGILLNISKQSYK